MSDPKKIQQAARKQQKRQQQQRLRRAQEIQRRLEEVDVQQKELEDRGVIVEKALRGEGLGKGRSFSLKGFPCFFVFLSKADKKCWLVFLGT